jgi:hypothetical protein
MKKLIESGIALYKQLTYTQKLKGIPKKKVVPLPYFSQWESPRLVKKILDGSVSAIDDPNWQSSGATDKKEYLHWSWNLCAMACVKMILTYRGVDAKLVDLGKRCMTYGGYTLHEKAYLKDDFRHSIDGVFYAGMVRFLSSDYALQSDIRSPLVLEEIIYEVSNGNCVMVSVSPRIRNPKDHPETKGGHVVLVTGYDLDARTVLINNPSGFPGESQDHASIEFSDFAHFFNGRGVVVYLS